MVLLVVVEVVVVLVEINSRCGANIGCSGSGDSAMTRRVSIATSVIIITY